MNVYYNENDPKTAAWLRDLIAGGLIPRGYVDQRDICDVLCPGTSPDLINAISSLASVVGRMLSNLPDGEVPQYGQRRARARRSAKPPYIPPYMERAE